MWNPLFSAKRRSRSLRLAVASLLVLLLCCSSTQAFLATNNKATAAAASVSRQTRRSSLKIQKLKKKHPFLSSRQWTKASVNGIASSSSSSSSSSNAKLSKTSINLALFASLLSWFAVSWEALMRPHPNPAVAAMLCLRHDILTFSQAIAFPFPIITAAYMALQQQQQQQQQPKKLQSRLLLGIGGMSLWTMCGIFFCKTFSRGFELFSTPTRYMIATVQGSIAMWALTNWRKSVGGEIGFFPLSRILRGCIGSIMKLFTPPTITNDVGKQMDTPDTANNDNNDLAMYSFSCLGLLVLAALPQLVGFPTATIPTILGKRFSRAASGITFLGGVLVYIVRDNYYYCDDDTTTSTSRSTPKAIQTLKDGLAIGAISHLVLVIGKFLGIDGGGLILPGNGLWEFYPSMVQASRAATMLMLTTYMSLAIVCSSSSIGSSKTRKE